VVVPQAIGAAKLAEAASAAAVGVVGTAIAALVTGSVRIGVTR
jgi:hypothetical protein